MSVCVCVCLCMGVYLCTCMSLCVCEITPVNTEKREAPIPSRRARGRQQPQELQDSVYTLRSLRSPSPGPALLLQHPVGRTETCCVCSPGGNAAPAHVELTVHEGPGFSPCKTLTETQFSLGAEPAGATPRTYLWPLILKLPAPPGFSCGIVTQHCFFSWVPD